MAEGKTFCVLSTIAIFAAGCATEEEAFRADEEFALSPSAYPFELKESYLRDLSDIDAEEANFAEAEASQAKWIGAKLKRANLTGITAGLKNWMGITARTRIMFHDDLQRSIAELAALIEELLGGQ